MPPNSSAEDTPRAGDTCFIAVPFAPEFNGIFNTIARAADLLHLRPLRIRTDEFQLGEDFVQDIISGVRSAKAVVAVCSPESKTRKPNPNVMYELGLAHAFGKPTVILTTNLKTRPSNLEGRHILKYRSYSVGKDYLILRIKDRLRERIDSHAQAAPPPPPKAPPMFPNQVFRKNLRTIISFSKNNGAEIQIIETTHVSLLQKAIAGVVANPNEQSTIMAFDEYWSKYNDYFLQTARPRVFDTLEENFGKVDGSFASLLALAEQVADARVIERIKKSKVFYGFLKDLLLDYIKLHDEIEENAHPLLQHKDLVTEVYGKIIKLSSTTRKITLQSDSLVANLIETILETGD